MSGPLPASSPESKMTGLKTRSKALVTDAEIPLTVDALKAAMPKRQKHNITPHLVDELNNIVTDPEEREAFRENLISYASVLEDPNVKLPDYVHAVRYVSFQLMGYTNQQSWIKTFPERYQRLIDDKKITEESDVFLRSTVSCYNRGKVVNTIREQTLIPTWVLNSDIHQKAINQLAILMTSSRSDKVRADAASSLLTHLKMPETVKMKLDVEVKEDESINQLRGAVTKLVQAQREAIETGVTDALRIAEAPLINAEYERVDGEN
jgi:hypothetical protein